MKLDYASLTSPFPIPLSVGRLRKPTLGEIFDTNNGMSYEKFSGYEVAAQLTPKRYFEAHGEEGLEQWKKMPGEEKDKLTVWSLLQADEELRNLYVNVFNFFLVEYVIFTQGYFVVTSEPVTDVETASASTLVGVINEQGFNVLLNLIQQVCCIASIEDDEPEEMKFKNERARKLWERMQKAQKEQEEREAKKTNKDWTIPNIISAVSSRHPSLNYTNIYNLTIPQLLESFNRTRTNVVYDLNAARVAAWGDEKKQFDQDLWFKNSYDKPAK